MKSMLHVFVVVVRCITCMVPGCWLISRWRLAVSLPVVHSFFLLALVMVGIDVCMLGKSRSYGGGSVA